MKERFKSIDPINACILAAGFLLTLITALTNVGVIAVDDYASLIAQAIPVQRRSIALILQDAGFRSPLPMMIVHFFAKLGFHLGLVNPLSQLKFVLVIFGSFSFFVSAWAVKDIFSGDKFKTRIGYFLISFYFLCPLFFTRAMIESLCAPFLVLSACFANRYTQKQKMSFLVFASLFLWCGFVFRYQVAVCFLVLIGLALFKRKYAQLSGVLLFNLLIFLLLGFLDQGLRGQFHLSLKEYFAYNVKYSSSHGTTPFYHYFLLLLGLSVPPVLVSRYRNFKWREEFKGLYVIVLYVFIFVIAHSFIPHKEERFMVPILSLFLILLVPLFYYFWAKNFSFLRLTYFSLLNFPLLFLVSFTQPQQNIIGLSEYLNRESQIESVVGVNDTLVMFLQAYVDHVVGVNQVSIDQTIELDCKKVVAVREDFKEGFLSGNKNVVQLASFQPSFIEKLLVKLNPKHNKRRSAIYLFQSEKCKDAHL